MCVCVKPGLENIGIKELYYYSSFLACICILLNRNSFLPRSHRTADPRRLYGAPNSIENNASGNYQSWCTSMRCVFSHSLYNLCIVYLVVVVVWCLQTTPSSNIRRTHAVILFFLATGNQKKKIVYCWIRKMEKQEITGSNRASSSRCNVTSKVGHEFCDFFLWMKVNRSGIYWIEIFFILTNP